MGKLQSTYLSILSNITSLKQLKLSGEQVKLSGKQVDELKKLPKHNDKAPYEADDDISKMTPPEDKGVYIQDEYDPSLFENTSTKLDPIAAQQKARAAVANKQTEYELLRGDTLGERRTDLMMQGGMI